MQSTLVGQRERREPSLYLGALHDARRFVCMNWVAVVLLLRHRYEAGCRRAFCAALFGEQQLVISLRVTSYHRSVELVCICASDRPGPSAPRAPGSCRQEDTQGGKGQDVFSMQFSLSVV